MKKALFLVVFTLFVAGCGAKQPGNKDAYQGDTDNCSQQFVNDYNSLVLATRGVTKTTELPALKAKAQSFKDLYRDVRCEASFGGEKKTVDASADADKLLSEIEKSLKR